MKFTGKLRIAGPCSAESPEQLLASVAPIEVHNYDVIRAGIWKPRTQPGAFEGRGEVALSWLHEVGQRLQKPTVVEVATPEHLAMALRANIDMIWIGARTTVNPFMVQELCEALRGVDVPVFVKNPISPDVSLWEGAIQRFLNVGVRRVAAIHRGFYSYYATLYRNEPLWSLPLELKRRLPSLSVLCDPSHIGGSRALLQPLLQESIDLLFDGWMVEVHATPDVALSDAQQQITPLQYNDLIAGLVSKRSMSSDEKSNLEMRVIRKKIDECDAQLLRTIGERLSWVKKIAALKQQHLVLTLQPDRWNEILLATNAEARRMGIAEDLVYAIMQALHQESIKIHREKIV